MDYTWPGGGYSDLAVILLPVAILIYIVLLEQSPRENDSVMDNSLEPVQLQQVMWEHLLHSYIEWV